MIHSVKDAFKNNLPKLEWMDAETRKAAVEKANAVINMIGFPQYILNSTALDIKYKGVRIHYYCVYNYYDSSVLAFDHIYVPIVR